MFFVVAVILLTFGYSLDFQKKINDEYLKMKEESDKVVQEKEKTLSEKIKKEGEAAKIFTLYDLTKEITKTFNEEEIFEIFQQELKQNVRFSESRFEEKLTDGLKHTEGSDDPFIFKLQWEGKTVGYLTVKGLSSEDRSIVSILGHQFALALRRLKLYQQLEKLAITDGLTGIYSRRYFLERFEEELNRSQMRKMNVSFLMIDVDHFKIFNDKYGHLTGDKILKEIAEIIRQNIREIDFTGRYGGEEFSVVLPDTSHEGVNFVAERIRSAIEKSTIAAYDTDVKTTVSIGMTTFPVDGKSANELIDKADWALYRAKKMGRNRICAYGFFKAE